LQKPGSSQPQSGHVRMIGVAGFYYRRAGGGGKVRVIRALQH
jgi:hypothetical protein